MDNRARGTLNLGSFETIQVTDSIKLHAKLRQLQHEEASSSTATDHQGIDPAQTQT
jgi:hypothetical protein